jgi:hypothetical protein
MAAIPQVADIENRVLSDAVGSPTVALMRLSLDIDRQLRLLLAASGQLAQYRAINPPEAIALLSRSSDNMPPALIESVGTFWRLRNKILHMDSDHEAYSLRVVDAGLRILRMLVGIARPRFVVKYAEIPLFADENLKDPLHGVKGIILQSYAADGKDAGLHFRPSTRTYTPGMSVSLEWRNGSVPEGWNSAGMDWLSGPDNGWESIHYSDPETGEIKHAGSSLEFAGRDLTTI